MDLEYLTDVLRCSACGAAYVVSEDRLSCSSCERCFAVVDDIPVLLDAATTGTACSVLHHLLDYEETIAHCYSVLKPGGAAVFYEPVLEGQTITTLFMALMLRSDEMANGSQFSEPDRGYIHGLIRNQMKSTFLRDRERKSSPRPTASSFRKNSSLRPDTSCSVVDTASSARASARGR